MKKGTLINQVMCHWLPTNGKNKEIATYTKGVFRMLLSAFIILHSSFLVSCSEHNNTEEEFVNWKEKNEKYFENLYTQTQQKIANNDKDWKIITNWSLQDSIAKKSYNHIIVHVLEEGSGSGYPMYTDSVRVHYSGKLLPSTNFPTGYKFDKSYVGTFNSATAVPSTFRCSSLTAGFATAIMNMRIGDRWEIYVPYQLGYGVNGSTDSNGKSLIPGYSTLIFEVTLKAFYRANETPPSFQSKQINGWIEE